MKPLIGKMVHYYLGDAPYRMAYVAFILEVLNPDSGRCFLRILNKGKGDQVTDFNQEANYSDEPESLHWSWPLGTDGVKDTPPDTGTKKA